MARALGAALDPHNTTQTFTGRPFTLLAPPGTDLWVKPNSSDSAQKDNPINVSNQPSFFLSPLFLSSIGNLSLTLSFVPTEPHDQAGVILRYTSDKDKWVKAGLEYLDGEAKRVVVATPGNGQGSDRSMAPPLKDSVVDSTGRVKTTVEVEREESGTRSSLLIKIGGELLRKVTWVFAGDDEPIQFGFYAARPSAEKKEDLEVIFETFEFMPE